MSPSAAAAWYDAGDLPGGVDGGGGGELVAVHIDERAVPRAVGGDGEFELRAEAVGDAERVDRDGPLGAGDDRPVGTQAGRDRLFHASVAARLDHGAARPVGNAVPGEQPEVSGELGALARLRRQFPRAARSPARHGRGGVGLQHRPDGRTGREERGRDR